MPRTAEHVPIRWLVEILACWAILIFWVACSTAPKGPRIAECLVGPEPGPGPFCDGELVPWGTSPWPGGDPTRYVCHRLDEHEAYRARCQP